MTTRNTYRLILAFLIVNLRGFAQEGEKEQVIQQRIEFISEQLETENLDLTDVVAQLNYYYDHPLNLNNATIAQLRELNLLSEVEINDLLLHRKLYGGLISIYELQALKYWDLETIRRVQPFVKVDDKLDQLHANVKEMFRNGKFEAFLRYQFTPESKSAYEDVPDSILQNSNSYYHGNADRYYTRLRFSYRTNLSLGVTAEKDPGEEFFGGTQPNGFDFYSAHAFYKGGKYLRTVALGDYQIQIGQGLNLWSGYAFGKTADVMNVKRSANPLKPYTSVDESRFLRGAAVELGYGKFALTTFASYKGVDGSILSDTLSEGELLVTSINISGLHRTNSEIARKHTLNEIIGGTNLRFEQRSFSAGVAAVYQGYEAPFIKDTVPYNQFDFRGKSTVGLSADYNFVFRNINLFGEIAHSTHSQALAIVQGLLIALDSRASFALMYRNYGRAYNTFYNAGFSEGSKTNNEKGIYAGLKLNLTSKFTINTYADVFSFPWLKYQVDAPSAGHEYLFQPSYRPSRSLEVYFRFREQLKSKNSRISDGSVSELEEILQRNYRINLSYKVNEMIQLKSRVEYVTVDRNSTGPEDGFILTQDLIYRPKSSPLDISLRYALFDTDSYDTRIYTYENNALYTFSIPAYYYKGSRTYVLIRYTFFRRVDLWVRYGVSVFANLNSIGSGAEEITGNRKSDITVQLRIKL